MKTVIRSLLVLAIVLMALGPSATVASADYNDHGGAPWIEIIGYGGGFYVTVRAHNFTDQLRVEAFMSPYDPYGRPGGIPVGIAVSGFGDSFTATYRIPAALGNEPRVTIRLQSVVNPNYGAYAWFYNGQPVGDYPNWPRNTPGGMPVQPQSGQGYAYAYPTFDIVTVVKDTSVTVSAYNLPPNKPFETRMGQMGTQGVGGQIVATFNTGQGGSQSYTFAIPSNMAGMSQIAIRMQATDGSGWYAYNWFNNK